ncbi:MAG: site-2 protease family protein [Cyanobacteriota bacterium]
MPLNNKTETDLSKSPVKLYRTIDNFNLNKFYGEGSIAKSANKIYSKREDIDLLRLNQTNIDSYSSRIIREHAPWEDFLKPERIKIAPDNAYEEDLILLESGLTTLAKKEDNLNKNKSSTKGVLGSIAAVIAIILVKTKGLAFLLFAKVAPIFSHFFLGILKFHGLLITAGSMIATILAYAVIFKFELAIGLVFLIFVHEMGHSLIINLKGLRAGLPVFIPFFGAFISIKDIPKDVITEAQIALGGPVLGSFAAFLMFEIFAFTGEQVWLYLAYIGFMLNLFNLTPVSPLDGGRIVAAISRKVWLIGFIILLVFTIILKTPALILMLFFALLNLLHNNSDKRDNDDKYYKVSLTNRTLFVLVYFGLVIFLGYATYYTHSLLESYIK